MPRKNHGTWEQLLQPAQQRPDADSMGRMQALGISSRKNFGSERTRGGLVRTPSRTDALPLMHTL